MPLGTTNPITSSESLEQQIQLLLHTPRTDENSSIIAQRLWTLLDQLHASHPAAYKRFLEQQKEQYQEEERLLRIQRHSSMRWECTCWPRGETRAKLTVEEPWIQHEWHAERPALEDGELKRFWFVNIVASERVQKVDTISPNISIPMVIGDWRQLASSNSTRKSWSFVCDIAVHPTVLQHLDKKALNKTEWMELIRDSVTQIHGVTLKPASLGEVWLKEKYTGPFAWHPRSDPLVNQDPSKQALSMVPESIVEQLQTHSHSETNAPIADIILPGSETKSKPMISVVEESEQSDEISITWQYQNEPGIIAILFIRDLPLAIVLGFLHFYLILLEKCKRFENG